MEGYWSLHYAWNNLARLASGEFLYLWNDDAIMETPEWDNIVGEYSGKVGVIQGSLVASEENPLTAGHDTCFPIIHRAIVETSGFLSPTPFNDTYIHELAHLLRIEIRDNRIQVTHNRNGNDETHANGAATSMAQGPAWQSWWKRYNSEEVLGPLVETAKRFRARFPKSPGTESEFNSRIKHVLDCSKANLRQL
jgi:hypothetical protein